MNTQKTYLSECLVHGSQKVEEGKGKNIIPEAQQDSLWKKFFEKFKDPIIVILLVVLALSAGISSYEYIFLKKELIVLIEPAGILIAILLSTGLAFIFEVHAEREFRILNKAKDERYVKVIRKNSKNGKTQTYEIHRCDVVLEDLVKLENGDEVPADCIILDSDSLKVDESDFTGEPYADKFAAIPQDSQDTTFPANVLLRGSVLLEGNCICKVIAVGPDTEEGKGAKLIQEETEVDTPLTNQLNHLGHAITLTSYIIAGLIIAGRLLYYFFFDGNAANNANIVEILEYILNSIMIAVTIIVVAVPEGLPMSVTISLALSMKKMLKEKNLVRKLHACETMGATSVICTDKTGTLTENKMKVLTSRFYVPDSLITQSIAINSTAELSEDENGIFQPIGNPTEGALLMWLKNEKGVDYARFREDAVILSRENFSSETKFMSTTIAVKEEKCSMCLYKGAPEIILSMCTSMPDGVTKNDISSTLYEWQSKAMRTIAFAIQIIKQNGEADNILFAGIIGIADPIRSDVKKAIDICRIQAGIRVIMVTGDVAVTANEIGRELDILDNDDDVQTLTGPEFASMTDEQAMEIIPKLKILSRARPEDKARLVTLLQKMGEVVAVTGDGTNDAPALKKAHVGLSMGSGTARAKEASDVTIIDNSFSSINNGIMWGRSIYLNIKRFILFQMTINVCACLIVLFGSFIGMDSPLTVTQMLWVNLIMDTFAALALASLPADAKVMNDRPRDRKSHIIDRKMGLRIIWVGLVFFLVLAFFWQILNHHDINCMKDLFSTNVTNHSPNTGAVMTRYEKGIFFTTFVILQYWNLFNARYFRTGRSFFSDLILTIKDPKKGRKQVGRGFLIISLTILIGQFIIVNGLGAAFDVEALKIPDWLLILLLTSPIMIIPDIIRIIEQSSSKR